MPTFKKLSDTQTETEYWKGLQEGRQFTGDILDTCSWAKVIVKTFGFYVTYPWMLILRRRLGLRNVRPVPLAINVGGYIAAGAYFDLMSAYVLAFATVTAALSQLVFTHLNRWRGERIPTYSLGESHLLRFTKGRFRCVIDCVVDPAFLAFAGYFFAEVPLMIYIPAVCLSLTYITLYRAEYLDMLDREDQAIAAEQYTRTVTESVGMQDELAPHPAHAVTPELSGYDTRPMDIDDVMVASGADVSH